MNGQPLTALCRRVASWQGASLLGVWSGILVAIALDQVVAPIAPAAAAVGFGAPLPAPESFVAPYPSFDSERLDQQLRLYADHLNRVGVPDVLIVGSSRALQGVDPTVLQQALAAQGYPDRTVYNFSINGATAKVIDLLLRRILTPAQLPRLIIWADGSRAFNSGRVDLTYNSIASSEGYQRLATGERPIRVRLAPTAIALPPADRCAQPSMQAATPRPVVPRPAGMSCDPPPATAMAVSAVAASPQTDLDATGFLPIETRFDPVTYYRQHPRVSGRYDANYAPFQLGGEQTAATIALAQFARSQQISLVFVSLPLSQDYVDSVRQRYEQQFRQHMQQTATQAGFLFRDLSQQWQTQNDYFQDPSHLNRYGAEAVARQLAIDASIPWQVMQPSR